MQNPYKRVGARTQAIAVPAPKSPAADGIAECDKAMKRMSQGEKSRERQERWNAIQAAEHTRPVIAARAADCFADETPDAQAAILRTAGRFASRVRATKHADAMATLAVRGFARFSSFVSYRQAFSDLAAFPMENADEYAAELAGRGLPTPL